MYYFSKGKLLISGEYVVLNGAKAFAVPTGKYGQSLEVKRHTQPEHIWQSFDINGKWFDVVFSNDLKETLQTSDPQQARLLKDILQYIHHEKPDLFTTGLQFTTELNYDKDWGFGSSSTLLANLQKWSGVSAFKLLDLGFGGSGYDVAVGLEGLPLLYQLTNSTGIDKNVENQHFIKSLHRIPKWQTQPEYIPDFAGKIWFVYLNKKQSSREAIKKYQKTKVSQEIIKKISSLSEKLFLETTDYNTFKDLIEQHEQLLSGLLRRPSVKTELFPDFPGVIKSLGAWGGDFILATGNKDTPDYFTRKNYKTIINCKELCVDFD